MIDLTLERMKRKLTREELANEVGVSTALIIKLEAMQHKGINPFLHILGNNVKLFADYFDVKIDELLEIKIKEDIN